MKRNGLVLFVWIVTILVGGGRAIDEVYIIGQRYVWVTGSVTYLPYGWRTAKGIGLILLLGE